MATAAPAPKVNYIGLPIVDYRGGKSTLCAGCGHNAISERIVDALFEMGVEPERVMKMSGIGCSSKTPAYFLSRSHASTACMGACGHRLRRHPGQPYHDDDWGFGRRRHRLHRHGQFVHLMRRNLPMIYIIEDNGVYGLTRASSRPPPISLQAQDRRGQRSARHRHLRAGHPVGRNLRGRSFSGDKKQLLSMLKAAIATRAR